MGRRVAAGPCVRPPSCHATRLMARIRLTRAARGIDQVGGDGGRDDVAHPVDDEPNHPKALGLLDPCLRALRSGVVVFVLVVKPPS